MESEMENMTTIKKQMKLHITEQQDKLKAYRKELEKKEQTIRNVNRVIKNVRVDIHYVTEHYQNPNKLKDTVKVRF